MASDVRYPAAPSAVEQAPASEGRRLQSERPAARLDDLQRRSTSYQLKLATAGMDWTKIRRVDHLPLVPFTNRQQLRDSLRIVPPFGERLAADPQDVDTFEKPGGK